MYKTKSIKFNFLMNSILTLSTIIFPLITFPYVSRVLSPEGVGKVSFATSFVSYFSMFAQLGIPMYGIRLTAKNRDNTEELVCCVKELLIINMIMTIISYTGFFLIIFTFNRFANEKILYICMSSTILLNSIGIEWLYKGLERYTYITFRSILFKVIAVIALFLFVHKQDDYVIYGFISVFASSASNILNFINARKYFLKKAYRKLHFLTHFKAVMIFFAMSCATTIYTHLDIIMIGIMNTDADVGYYNSAIKIKQFLVSVITSLGAVLLPRSSYFIETNQFNDFKKISNKAIYFILIAGIPITIYFIIFAEPTVYFLSGSEYYYSILPMQILMPTVLFIGLSNLLGIQMLVPLGEEKHILYSEILGAIIDFTINLFLIPKYLSVGAAIGTLFAELSVLLYQFFILYKIVGKIFKSVSYMKIFFAIMLSIIISFFTLNLELSYFFTLCISAVLFYGTYIITLLLCKEQFILGIVKEFISKLYRRGVIKK